MSEPPVLAEPLGLGRLLDEAVKQFRRHFRSIFLPVALPLALFAGLVPLAQGLWFRSMSDMESGVNPGRFLATMVLVVLISLLFLLVYGLGYGALLAASVDAVGGREVSMARAWRAVLRPRALGTLFLASLATSVGFLLCVLPGIYVGLILAVVVPVMIEEGRYGTAALSRSAELMGYNPQRDFGADPRVKAFVVILVGMLLGYALGFTIQLPLIVLQQVMIFRSVSGGERVDPQVIMARMVWLQVPTSMISMVVQTATYLYVALGLALLFFDVRFRREAGDLEAAIGRLAGSAPPPSAPAPPP